MDRLIKNKGLDLQPAAFDETRILIESRGEQHLRLIRRSNTDGTIVIEHRPLKEMPFRVNVQRG
jgi:hypothetical protein